MIYKKVNVFFAYALLVIGIFGCSNRNKNTIVNGQYYVREVVLDEQDPFEVISRDTIIILEQKNGYVKWTLKKWQDNSNFWISTPEKYMIKRIKPCH